MPSTIVVGGQYGSEGKGKVVALCASQLDFPWVIRCGGPNSGHTIWVEGKRMVLRQIPAAAGHPNAVLLLSAGCVIDEELLCREADDLRLPRERVLVDPRAVLVTEADRRAEQELAGQIGSTASGTGAALVRRMSRSGEVALAGSSARLRERFRIETVAPLVHEFVDGGGDLIVEGTQGFGLSLLHGFHYPHVTARDTTASAFASEVGLSPRQIDEIVMVIRTFPIRVGGASGPLEDEITWETIQGMSRAPALLPEFTSVTGKLRRVARFDIDAVKTACMYNRPTSIAVMGLDRLDHANHRVREERELTLAAREWIRWLAEETGTSVGWLGTGFETEEAICLKGAVGHAL